MNAGTQKIGFGERLTFTRSRGLAEVDARQTILKGVSAAFVAWARNRTLADVVAETYGGDDMVMRAAVNPAMVNTPEWAGALSANTIGPFQALAPNYVYAQLAARGLRASFDGAGRITVPDDPYTTGGIGMFVTEGEPIPVGQGSLAGAILEPRKAAGIVAWTREMARGTPLTLQNVFGAMLETSIGRGADERLLSTAGRTAAGPGGLRLGVDPIVATTTGAIVERIATDLHNLAKALTDDAPIQRPVFIMSGPSEVAVEVLSPGNDLDIIAAPTFARDPENIVMCIDAADFVSAEGEEAEIQIGEEATLHMDTEPAEIVGADGTPAVPSRSLWQTASVGLRIMHFLDWNMRHPGRVAWLRHEWFVTT